MRTFIPPLRHALLAAAVLVLPHIPAPSHAADARAIVKVVEEDGTPIAAAHVYVTFTTRIDTGEGKRNKTTAKEGKTGEDGLFTVEQASDEARIWYGATKAGYYRSSLEYSFEKEAAGRWEPWSSERTVVLRKVKNPLPMFAKKVRAVIPETGKKVGYDLEKGDWLPPHGEGKTSDFLFLFSGRFENFGDREEKLTISFPNERDGIIEVTEDPAFAGSELRVPYEAPEKGYQKTWEREKSIAKGSAPKNLKPRTDRHFIFRVRSAGAKDTEQGGKYGKILGDIDFGFLTGNSREPMVAFTYTLNPNGTRGLEFHRDKNLLENLKPAEKVSTP